LRQISTAIFLATFAIVSAQAQRPNIQAEAANAPRVYDVPAASSSATTSDTDKKHADVDPNAYIIGEQDVLNITVWKEKDLSGGSVVRPDGKITVPLVGEIKVVGMTPVQLQSLLADKLKPYVTVPQVTVAVNEIRSRKVYLIGHAGREGPFMINSKTTVLQIIAQAGGLKDFAKRKKIYILRQNGQEQQRFPFNYDAVLKGKHREQNILLSPGDTIVVP
jgi:polysaccharide export outer membrane protein